MPYVVKPPVIKIEPVDKPQCALGLGCWAFGGSQWGGQEDEDSRAAMQAAYDLGVNHFDTAQGYGAGRSEQLVGEFLQGRRDEVYLATKFFPSEQTAQYARDQLEVSRQRLQTDYIDLFYIHWPKTGADLRPVMEGLEAERSKGRLLSIGVSNFSPEQMDQVSEVGKIDAHQLCYNLFWRYPERDVIPYCVEHDIAVVTYSSIAQGILTGKFPKEPTFKEGDSRPGTVYFDPEVWPHVYEGVERLKALSEECQRTLTHLAIRWVLAQPGVASELVGARNAQQMQDNAAALDGDIPADVFSRMTEISDEVMSHIPDVGNIFRFYP
ncbi:MAG: aldo/keto reductase [Armatimonadetes bacterium]|nr:aldo/keto reductase [Armatimonadota bacterium]